MNEDFHRLADVWIHASIAGACVCGFWGALTVKALADGY